MKHKVLRIINKLYFSLSILILGGISVYGVLEIKDELYHANRFDKVHTYLEKIGKYNPQRPGLTLQESRELLTIESMERLEKSFSTGTYVKPPFHPIHSVLDNSCFDRDGDFREDPRQCLPLDHFSPGYPVEDGFRFLGVFLGAALALFFIRRWVLWLVK